MRQDFASIWLKIGPAYALSAKLLWEWKTAEQSCQQHDAAISILDVSRMHDGVQQQLQSVNQDMPLLVLDQFAAVKSVWIDARTTFLGI